MCWRVAVLLSILSTWPLVASAQPMVAASPCTLTVFEDETLRGCDEPRRQVAEAEFLSGGFEIGRFVMNASEHAVSLMRAWRTKRTDGVFSRTIRGAGGRSTDLIADFEGPGGAAEPYLRRGKTESRLRRQFEETLGIDSMAVEVFVDSASAEGGGPAARLSSVRTISTRLWIARKVRGTGGATEAQVCRLEYLESWVGAQGLLGFEEVNARYWKGSEATAALLAFPRRASVPAKGQ